MSDKIPAAVDRALGELDEKIAAVDQSKEIAAVDAKVDEKAAEHFDMLESIKESLEGAHEKIQHLFDSLAHILPPMKD